MTTEKRMLIAFLLNALFAVAEYVGGMLIGSVAIMSDAVHDLGDAVSIGLALVLERRSKHEADETYTYGYARFSVLGGAITGMVLLIGSAVMIVRAVMRLIEPTSIAYDGMIAFAVIGFAVNLCAARLTHTGETVGQRAVNLHMLEDVLGWLVVLVGAVVMRFTQAVWLDAVMSLGVAVFVLLHTVRNLREVTDILLEKLPRGLNVAELKAKLASVEGVRAVHHLHVWSMDGCHHLATLHAEADETAKGMIRSLLAEHGVVHVTIETDEEPPACAFEAVAHGHTCVHGHHHGEEER